MGLKSRDCDHDCQAAEDHKIAFVLIRPGLSKSGFLLDGFNPLSKFAFDNREIDTN
jgi:hypothetical protein